MISDQTLRELSADTTPARVAALLTRLGWEQYGGQRGLYSRWRLGGNGIRLILPLDRDTADFQDLLTQAIFKLATQTSREDLLTRALSQNLRADDLIRFSKDVSTVAGAVPWPIGREIVGAAEEALLAAAKTRLSRRPYYGNANGFFAHRFLNECMMGQTEIGSYVVTAFAPAEEQFPERETPPDKPTLPDVASYSGRDISHALMEALSAIGEAVEHYESTESLAGFEDAVPRGISREMTVAVHRLVKDSDGAEVKVEWTTIGESAIVSNAPEMSAIEFSGGSVVALERAARKLETMAPVEYVRAAGWVSLIARPKRGERGLIRLKTVRGTTARTLKIPLTEEQFELAASAITQQKGLIISGRQETERRTTYLYDARDLQLFDLEPAARPTNPDQSRMDI